MSDCRSALASFRAFITDPTDAHAEALRPHLASELEVSIHTTNEKGADAVIAALQQSLFHNVVFGGQWQEPSTESDITTQVLSMPVQGIAAGCKFQFTFDEHAKLRRIDGEWMLPPATLTPKPIVLTTAMHARINSAEDDLMSVLFAYVTPDGRPEQVFRRNTHTHGDDQLAFWNPRSDGSFLTSIGVSPRVSAIYRHNDTHEMLEMSGRARVVGDENEAREIYDCRSEVIRRADPGRNGVAVVVDLDRVTGLMHNAETGAIERILMVRDSAA